MKRSLTVILVAVLTVGVVVGAAAQPALAAQRADLHIEQPSYIESDVAVDDSGDARIYEVSGPEFEIWLQNADHENVTSVAVQDGPGQIEYDEQIDAYRFDSQGQAGTSTLVFQVNQGGNGTEYEAVLQVSKVNWTHQTSESAQKLQEQAQQWQDIQQEAEDINPNEDPEDVISTGLTFAKFFESPFSTFVDDIRAVLIIMFFRPGGWAVLGLMLAITLAGVASGARYKNRTQKQLAEWGDIQVEKDEAHLKKARRILQQNDWNQLFPDDIAHSMRTYFGRNVWQGYKSYMLIRSPVSVKGTVLQMMAQIGYTGYVEKGEDGEILDRWVDDSFEETDGGNVEEIDLTDLDFEDPFDRSFIEAIPPEQLDDRVFAVPPEKIDLGDVSFPISNREVDDAKLLEAVNPDFPEDYENEAELAELLAEMMQFVIEHPHTDEWGRSRDEMDILSFLCELDTVLADEADFPVGHFNRRILIWLAENLDADAELSETIERIDEGGVDGEFVGGDAS